MKIQHASELMQNQKQAAIMSTDSLFQVLESYDGHSLFFSIGTDHVFYLTRELNSEITGWSKLDLSSSLTIYHNGKPVQAKAFAVTQSPVNGAIDLALAITVEDVDYLYLSLGNSNTDTSWEEHITWLIMPFNDPGHIVPILVITDIYISQSDDQEYILVDILKDPGSSLNYIYRYAIDPSDQDGNYWIPNDLSANLDASGLTSCLGRKKGQLVDGIYTYGQNVGQEELLYTPLWNVFDKKLTPNPIRLNPPKNTTAIAAALAYQSVRAGGSPVFTDLFAAADGSLYYFPWDKQTDGATGISLISNDILANVRSLYAYSDDKILVVWGLNEQGQIFYLECPVGQQTNSSAWTYPLPIVTEVEQMAFFINDQRNNNVLFALTRLGELLQLTQDPVTSTWIQRKILLPTTEEDDILEVNTFTTQINITGDDYLPAASVPVSITSTSPVSVYIDNVYHHLKETIPLEVLTDQGGNISIMQETQAIGAICYHLTLADGSEADINPMNKMLDIMEKVKSGTDLGAIEVTDEDGEQQPLVPKDTPTDQLDITSLALQQLVATGRTMPSNGSNQPDVESKRHTSSKPIFASTGEKLWGVSYEDKWVYREGALALDYYKQKYNTEDLLFDSIKCIAGDAFNWLKHAYQDVTGFFSDVIDDVAHFFIELGGKLYSFVLNSINVVIRSIEFVFNKIKVFIEDLIKWIGFLFQWKDILRTHNVLKNLFMKAAYNAVDHLDDYKLQLIALFAALEGEINRITGLPDITRSISSYSSDSPPKPEQNSPQANWGLNQTKNNADASSTSFDPKLEDPGALQSLLDVLLNTIEQEEEIFTDAIEEIKTQIIDQLTTLPVIDIIKRILGVLSKIVLLSAENVIIAVFDILKIMVQGAIGLLDAPINFPVISKIYKKITKGSEFTIMDMVCLVVAIPCTVIYKAVYNKPPFSESEFTHALIQAPDFKYIQQLYSKTSHNHVAEDEEKVMSTILDFCAGAASIGMLFFNYKTFLGKTTAKKMSTAMGMFGVGTYICYMAPNLNPLFSSTPASPWYVDLNYAITGVSLVKALADVFVTKSVDPPPPIEGLENTKISDYLTWDNISPFVETCINLIWCVPPIMTLVDAAKDDQDGKADTNIPASVIISCTGDFAFNLGGIITPGLLYKNEVVPLVTFVGMEACTVAYGALTMAAAITADV